MKIELFGQFTADGQRQGSVILSIERILKASGFLSRNDDGELLMSEPEPRIFPRSSAFEALLAKVYLELWELQDDPTVFNKRVEKFAKYFLPTMFQSKVIDKLPNFNEMITNVEEKVKLLEKAKFNSDPFTEEMIDKGSIPAETVNIAWEVWHAIVDVLTEMGFNFPMATAKPRRQMRP